MQCLMRENRWYESGKTIVPQGIVVHSSGANNPQLRRYVQPSKGDENYWNLMAKIGTNQYGNHWNVPSQDYGMHAFVGKLADDSVEAVQTLPWHSFLWGCGSGEKGSYNNSHIQFEICEDTTDEDYTKAAFHKAAELCAHLCESFSLPVSSIVSHAEAHRLGYASNHGDPAHWWSRYGLSMDGFREKVAELLDDGGSSWSKEARLWAKETGIVRGDGESMAWKRFVTREELVQMLYRMRKSADCHGIFDASQ